MRYDDDNLKRLATEWEMRHQATILMSKVVFTLILIAAAVLFMQYIGSCGIFEPEKTPTTSPPSEDDPLCPVVTRERTCPEGAEGVVIESCQAGRWTQIINTCSSSACETVTFEDDIKPITIARCSDSGCHAGRYDNYDTTRARVDDIIRRINAADVRIRMPKIPKPALPPFERATFERWKAEGLIESCETQGNNPPRIGFKDRDYLEALMVVDATRLDADDRANVAYLIPAHRVNAGADGAVDLAGMAKGLNSINVVDRDLYAPVALDVAGSVYRIDLRNYNINYDKWRAIQAAEPFDIISQTTAGKVLQQLTGKAQPWFHHDNFLDTIFRQSELYYLLTNAPATFPELESQLGCRYRRDLQFFDALFVGLTTSPISIQKNRAISFHECRDNLLMTVTYDVVSGDANSNLQQFPLIAGTGGTNFFNFAAGEIIYEMPNGLLGYYLADAENGKLLNRANAAPTNIVQCTETDSGCINAEIRAANSCHGCHRAGLRVAVDEIADSVRENAAQFTVRDAEIIQALYRSNGAAQATFTRANNKFAEVLRKVGASPESDPITQVMNTLLLNHDLASVANFFFVPAEEFRVRLGQSANARLQVGQLLSGGTITYDQLVASAPVLIKDLRLFEDRINQ